MTTTATTTKFYPVLVEPQEGPAYIQVQIEPGCTNMSREPRIEGWLGTTNNTRREALGKFETLEDCKASMEEAYDGIHELENDRNDHDIIEVWGLGKYPVVSRDVSETWCHDGARALVEEAKRRGYTAIQAQEYAESEIDSEEVQDAGGGEKFLLDPKGIEDAISLAIDSVYGEE